MWKHSLIDIGNPCNGPRFSCGTCLSSSAISRLSSQKSTIQFVFSVAISAWAWYFGSVLKMQIGLQIEEIYIYIYRWYGEKGSLILPDKLLILKQGQDPLLLVL